MKIRFKSLGIILAVAMLFSVRFDSAFAETEGSMPAVPAGAIVILHTNDLHSKVNSPLGYASVKGWKDYYAAQNLPVLILDAGDALHGYPVANLSQGKNIVDFMNAVGYTAMTPGNHDFNYGTARLIELSKMMQFDLLSANFTDGRNQTVFPPARIYSAGNNKVGIVGISTPETASKTNPLNVAGYDFNPAKLVAMAQAQIDRLRQDGADYIVVLGHLGMDEESSPYRSADIIGQLTGLDIFIDGHSHTALENGERVKDKDGREILLAQAGTQAAAIGRITIDKGVISAALITEAREDAAVKLLIAGNLAAIQPLLDVVVARTEIKLDGNRSPGVRTQETNLGDLAADALKYVSGANVALTNGGGIRASIENGDITYGEINTVFPFGNLVTTIEITGADLLAALEHGTKAAPAAAGGFPQVAGMSYEIHTYLDAGRIQQVKINGEALNLAKTYLLATNDFTVAGGDGYTMLAKYPISGQYGALDEALVKYINQGLGGTVGSDYAQPQGRISLQLPPFADVDKHWAAAAITEVATQGLVTGITDEEYQPDAAMTRAMFVTVLSRLSGDDVTAYHESKFRDVAIGSWYGQSVQWAEANGIASGLDGNTFAPQSEITREQMAAMLTNYCRYIGKGPVGLWVIRMTYTDLDQISSWANEGIMFATMKSYIKGYPDGSFGPQHPATRGEAAQVLANFLAQQVQQ